MQREISDDDNTTWRCAQAYAGLANTEVAEAAAEKIRGDDGTVPVVCTPSGGAQSVRVALPEGWSEGMSDAELLRAIRGARPDG